MTEIYTRRIKGITGNGTSTVKIYPDPAKRLHNVELNITFAGGTTAIDTVVEQMGIITEVRVLVGSTVRRRLTGTQWRDYMLLNGTTYDFEAVSTYVAQCNMPFSEDWFLASVADSLAWNPALLGGAISIEIDCNPTYTMTVSALQEVSDDLNAPSSGIITWEVITPVVGGTATYIEKEIKARGSLIQASFYADSSANALTKVSTFIGANEAYAYEAVLAAENLHRLDRAGLTPTASGRTQTIFDLVFVRGDALAHALNLETNAPVKFKVEAASLAGNEAILLARLEAK
jgi:hypothetical protein